MTTLHQLHVLVQAALRSHGPDTEVLITVDGFNLHQPILRFCDNAPLDSIVLGPPIELEARQDIPAAPPSSSSDFDLIR